MDASHPVAPFEPNRQATVRDSMGTAVITVERCAHVAAAAYLMGRSQVTALVVMTDHANRRPIAIITDTDIAQALADGIDINEARIDELIGPRRITVQPETALSDAIALMVSAGIRQLPVVEEAHLVGMLDITDTYRAVLGAYASGQRRTSAGYTCFVEFLRAR